MIKKLLYILPVLIFCISCNQKSAPNSIEKKIDALLSKMTLEEKIGQMNQLTTLGLHKDMQDQIKQGKVGSILNETDPKIINELQKIAVTQTRLGIPLVFARDVIHGYKTIFPIPLGQACSWNPQIAQNGGRVAAIEATASGIRWTFSPMIDITRDPRWGRIAESCGEDPYLTSVMGAAMVKGFQGENLSDPTSMAACAKHFVGYGATESGKDYNSTFIPENQMRDVYLPSFKATVDVGCATFMCAFNDVNGVPASGNVYLNRKVLRNEWKFDGVMVSDWNSITQMTTQGVCADTTEAAKLASDAGVDMDMMGMAYINKLELNVESGKISEKQIDESVRNILRLKFRLGLFDNPYTKITNKMPFYSRDALEKAKQAAIESAVLLKNDNQVLPLSNKIKSVAVIGPMSDAPADQLGTWSMDGEPAHSITPLMAIQQAYGKQVNIFAEKGLAYSRDKNIAGIAKAVATARKADVILYFAGEEAIISGEAHCRADISLPGSQSELLNQLKKTGKPIITIIIAGRPLTIQKEVEQSDAVIFAFQGGTMAGPALADLIFGKAVFSGKLAITFPRMVGQIPIYYSVRSSGRPAKNIVMINDIPLGAFQTSLGNTSYHLDAGDKPLFPFGYGLSYTSFRYSPVKLSKREITENETVTAECTITNTGKVDGIEIVQLYVRDPVATIARPVRELKGFQKIRLKVGESKTVKFNISPKDIGFWHFDNRYKTEPGEFRIWISPDSQTGEYKSFSIK